jgi:hypothetical protein
VCGVSSSLKLLGHLLVLPHLNNNNALFMKTIDVLPDEAYDDDAYLNNNKMVGTPT